MESIPANIWRETGHTLDWSPVNRRGNTDTYNHTSTGHLESPINLTTPPPPNGSLDCKRKPEYLAKIHAGCTQVGGVWTPTLDPATRQLNTSPPLKGPLKLWKRSEPLHSFRRSDSDYIIVTFLQRQSINFLGNVFRSIS